MNRLPLAKVKKQLNKLQPAVALRYAELLLALCSCAGLATEPQGAVDFGALQLRLLDAASQLLNRTADLDESAEESAERVGLLRAALEALEREVREHSELAGLIDGLTSAGPESLKSRPVTRLLLRF